MNLNKVFQTRIMAGFKMRQLYLTALHQACLNQNKGEVNSSNDSGEPNLIRKRLKSGISDNVTRALRLSARNSRRKKKMKEERVDDLNDKIDLEAIITYEQEEKTQIHKSLKKILKKVDSIFLNSFKEINEKNMKSFLWQNFSIYARKPGLDLSPFIIISLAIFTFYGAFFINQLMGQPKTMLDQLYRNNSVSLELTSVIVFGLGLIIGERFIYKYNPKEWREKFDESKKKERKP